MRVAWGTSLHVSIGVSIPTRVFSIMDPACQTLLCTTWPMPMPINAHECAPLASWFAWPRLLTFLAGISEFLQFPFSYPLSIYEPYILYTVLASSFHVLFHYTYIAVKYGFCRSTVDAGAKTATRRAAFIKHPTRAVEVQMDKKMQNEMDAREYIGIIWGFYRGYMRSPRLLRLGALQILATT